ncbi:hypothetical protein SUGI_0823820 [Cryptomeria japonica]|nr:hypothetical protein SUGI_0823820 [Cryptomeria japonica]
MQSDQVLLPIAYDLHMNMGTLGTKALHHAQEEIFHRDIYSDESMYNSRFIFYASPSPPPSIAIEAAVVAAAAAPKLGMQGKGGQLQESSSGQSQANSASEEAEEQHNNSLIIDERKQRRMLSNRESARRSRMRKQKHLDELRAQVAHMRAENRQMMSRFEIVSRSYNQLLEENRVLKSQTFELSHQLQQLHEALAVSQSASSFAAALKLMVSHTTNIEMDDPHSELLV